VESPVATIKPTIVVVVEVAYIALLGAEFSAVSGIGMLVTLPPLRNSRSLAVAQHCYNGGHFYTFEKKSFPIVFGPLQALLPRNCRALDTVLAAAVQPARKFRRLMLGFTRATLCIARYLPFISIFNVA